MSADKAKALFTPLILAALRTAETLSPIERADVFEGVAHLTEPFDHEMSAQAKTLAAALRDAESLQLHFKHMLLEHS